MLISMVLNLVIFLFCIQYSTRERETRAFFPHIGLYCNVVPRRGVCEMEAAIREDREAPRCTTGAASPRSRGGGDDD